MLVVVAHPHRRDHYVPLGLSSDPMIFEPGASNFCQHNADACQSRERAPRAHVRQRLPQRDVLT